MLCENYQSATVQLIATTHKTWLRW